MQGKEKRGMRDFSQGGGDMDILTNIHLSYIQRGVVVRVIVDFVSIQAGLEKVPYNLIFFPALIFFKILIFFPNLSSPLPHLIFFPKTLML